MSPCFRTYNAVMGPEFCGILNGGPIPRVPLMRSPVIVVGRARRGSAAGDLRTAGVRLGQWCGEGDAGAGDMRTDCKRPGERRGEDDRGRAVESS